MHSVDVQCGWNTGRGTPDDLEGLHAILLCAARRGCSNNVECSERALQMVLQAARKAESMPPPPLSGKD